MLNGSLFCTLGLSLETVILPVDESPDSLERVKGTGYSLHDLAGKVNLVFLSGALSVLLRAGAVITGGSNSTGFPRADLVNAKFTSKGNILSVCQWLKAIWLSLAVCFPKNRKGQLLGQLQLHFWALWRLMFWFAEGLGRKTWDQGLCWPWDRKNLRTRPEFHQNQAGAQTTGNKKITVNSHGDMEDTHTAETPNQCLQHNYMEMSTNGITPLFVVWYISGMNQIYWFYFSTTTITDTQSIGKILPFFFFWYPLL